ncbi:MAG: hypothetical protein AB1457_17520 [Chloroflexota bacterium]
MNYFEGLAIGFGLVMILTRPLIHLFPRRWADFEMNQVYTRRQPVWVWLVGAFGLGLVGWTWYIHFTRPVPYSIVVTLIVSLTLIKLSQVLFNYQQFRTFADRVLHRERRTMNLISLATGLLGLMLIGMGIWIY